MAVNKYANHLVVLPEDDANRDLANGFAQGFGVSFRHMKILLPAGGWPKVRAELSGDQLMLLRQYPLRHLVLLIDFDDDVEACVKRFSDAIPEDVAARVYLLGAKSDPEKLRAATNIKLEALGEKLARECADGESALWDHALISHNRSELNRLVESVKPFLFNGFG